MTRINVMEARKAFSDTINRVAFGKERIVLERHGKDVAAIVSLEDLELFERLLEEHEAREDLAAAREALDEMDRTGEKPLSAEDVHRELGLD